MSDSDSVEEILDRHFQIEGAIIRVFEPFQAKAALDRHYAQKHAAEVLELIGQIKGNRDYSWKTIEADLRKAVEEHWGV